VATSSSQFFRQIGATVGTAVFGAILIASLAGSGGGGLSLDALEKMAFSGGPGGAVHAVSPALRAAFTSAMIDIFWCGVAIGVLGLIAILAIPELPMRGRAGAAEPLAEPGEGAGAGEFPTAAEAAGEPARV
jgi:hypothetical protein